MKIVYPILVFTCLFFAEKISAQQTFYNLNTLQKIEINFPVANWDYQMDTAKIVADGYLMATWVKVNGVQFDTVGVKYKGNSSYDSTYVKNPLHISLAEFKNQNYQGVKNIKLGNGYSDPSMIREVLSYSILKNYMDCSQSNFAELYINGVYIGLYSNDESIDKIFLANHFYSSGNSLIKCNPIVNPSASTKCNLKYITADSSAYFNYYDLKSKYGWHELVDLCDTVTNYPSNLASALDMDRTIWMLAFDNVLVNLDSYMGVFEQNYYLYKDNTNHFNPVIWDLNMSFGGFPFLGSGATGFNPLTVATMQTLSPSAHATDAYWGLIKDVNANPTYQRMYIAHLRTITNEMFANNSYQTVATQLQTLIDTAVQNDVNKFYSYNHFQNAMTLNDTIGSFIVPGITTLMAARVTSLQASTEFSYAPPVITAVTSSTVSPAFNASFNITANVTNTNASSVYLGYRFDKTQKFIRVLMYDDGTHGDGASGDNVYGASITMAGGQMQYYIYAENSTAGMFSPERAEHEFYLLNATATVPLAGEVVINELLANNNSKEKDEYNEREDWVELYNNSTKLIDLSNVYLSDTISQLHKWKFPAGTTINPASYLMVWADNDSSQFIYHTNFSLNNNADALIMSNAGGTILDSVSFANQSADISFGRFPNGTGSFIKMPTTTFDAENNNYALMVNEVRGTNGITLYPNPAENQLSVIGYQLLGNTKIQVYDVMGRAVVMLSAVEASNGIAINVSKLASGLYLVKLTDSNGLTYTSRFSKI